MILQEFLFFFILFFIDLRVISPQLMKFDITVSSDGSGDFRTITEAVAAAPSSSKRRYYIHITRGTYEENVFISKEKINLAFIGDGAETTKILGNRSNAGGFKTFDTATVSVDGAGFIARDIAFVNTAGPTGGQAVALKSRSDKSAFYRCRFEGYQDTLYVYQNKQFYRDCEIYGTVDFIFGRSTVVFQNCKLYGRRPLPSQGITITADGTENPNQGTGIVIHNCSILATPELEAVKSDFSSYFGRPWRPYATTIIMQSFISDFISPKGWSEWSDAGALSTLTYGEYRNTGPGSNTTGRVTWPGFKVYSNSSDVLQYTVANFIKGTEWLPSTGVPFTSGLM